MDILIDVQALQSPNTRQRGIGRYTRNLIAAIVSARPTWRIELVQSAHLEAIGRNQFEHLPITTFRTPFAAGSDFIEANERFYADWLTARNPEIILTTSFFDDRVLVPRFTGSRPRWQAILYDLIPLLLADAYLKKLNDRDLYASRFRRLLTVDAVLSISEASATDLRRLAPDALPRVITIGGAPESTFRPCSKQDANLVRQRLGLKRPFFLYVGGFDWRKNLKGALAAFAALPCELRDQYDVVIACHLVNAQRQQVLAWARELGISRSLRITGYVSDEELRALYSLCRLFLFPSLYEGLGLPVLEALRCGAPVVASNRAALPEVAGQVSWLAEPDSPWGLAAAIVAALEEPRDRRRLERIEFAEQFRWDQVAEHACRSLETRAVPQLRRVARKRLAWLSPLPPALSGIADYAAELLEPLSEWYDIELITNPAEPPVTRELARRHLLLSPDEVASRHEAAPYDLFIFHVGNSHHHIHALDLLRRYPGLMVLHDFFLGGLIAGALHCGAWPGTLADEVEHENEVDVAAALRTGRIDEAEILDRIPLNCRILSLASGVVVHSHWSWQRVRERVHVPVACVPMAVPIPTLGTQAQERQRLRIPADRFIVASLGFVGPPKRLDSLLSAVAMVRQSADVWIVGHATPRQQGELVDRARQLGIAANVHFTGRVPLDDFAAYARAADVCVQLRYPTRGETSAALVRELAAGAACIVSDHGSIGEIPDEIVLKVRTPNHEIPDLAAALTRLQQDANLRARLGSIAARHMREHHSLKQVARQHAAMIDLMISRRETCDSAWVENACNSLAHASASGAAALKEWAALRIQGQKASHADRFALRVRA